MSGRRATPKEIEEVIEQVYEAFRGVTREGGVSWSEADVIDSYGSQAQRNRARLKDKDRTWQQLVDDPKWCPEDQTWHWSFLDPIGFRYYMAAAMIRFLKVPRAFDMDLEDQFKVSTDYRMEQWSALTAEQNRVTSRVVLTLSRMYEEPEYRGEWRHAYESYWQKFDK